MTMQRRLWSINALATELGKDRRTIAKRLDGVPIDGQLSGHPAWYLATALAAVEQNDTRDPSRRREDVGFVSSHFCERLRSWQEIHGQGGRGSMLSIEETALLLGVDTQSVLLWLRAGMPYVKEGDFETGAGFRLRPSWVLDWMLTLSTVCLLTEDEPARRALRLPT